MRVCVCVCARAYVCMCKYQSPWVERVFVILDMRLIPMKVYSSPLKFTEFELHKHM